MALRTELAPALPDEAIALLTGARLQRGITVSALAEDLHTSRRFLQRVENGRRVPSSASLEAHARAVGLGERERALLHALRRAVR